MTTPIGPYSPVLVAGDFVYLSGQLGLADGALVPGGVEAEVAQLFANARTLLDRAGARLDQVVKCTVFLTTLDNFGVMNSAYVAEFGGHRPTRSTIGNIALPAGASVEIEFTAFTGASGIVEP